MSRLIGLVLSSALAFAVCAASAATNLLDLKVEYSADTVIGSGDNPRTGHLSRTPTALRHDIDDHGQTQTVIVRLDKNAAWMVLPALKMALGTDLNGLTQLSGAAGVLGAAEKLKPVAVGSETIEGMRATKYRVQMNDPEAGQFDGFVWSTSQGVVLKIDGAGEQNGRRGTVHIVFRNVQIGRQDAALFEPPAGYKQVTVAPDMISTMMKTMEQMQRLRSGAQAPPQ
ncbi:MAG TPA: hypothetical protein VGB82_03935 [Alphaproteobacteria bacterium]